MTEHVTVDFRFRRWALVLLSVAAAYGLQRVADWTIAHGTYFDYGH